MSTSGAAPAPILTEAELKLLQALVYQECGMHFDERRTHFLQDRLQRRLRECQLDVQEGADALIVKPALPYLDVLRAVRERFELPVGAYNVSGEYAMLKAAAQSGWLDERQAALESLTSIVRAGADVVISYWTKDLAQWL